MQKLLHIDSPRDWYHSDAAIVWCFDSRFDAVLRKLTKRRGWIFTDRIRIAGASKCLAKPDRESDREFVLDQIQKSMRLHGTDRVALTLHSDCGAYGGIGAFSGDEKAEARHHAEQLQRAEEVLLENIPGLAVERYFINFEGVWRPEAAVGVETAIGGE